MSLLFQFMIVRPNLRFVYFDPCALIVEFIWVCDGFLLKGKLENLLYKQYMHIGELPKLQKYSLHSHQIDFGLVGV